jgi:sec-independent protein translocase protein TatA
MPNIGPLELAIILVIVLIVFGPKRLPGLGRQLGGGLREFKESLTGDRKRDDEDEDGEHDRRELPEAEPAVQRRAAEAPEPAVQPRSTAAPDPEPEVVTGEARADEPAGSPRSDA